MEFFLFKSDFLYFFGDKVILFCELWITYYTWTYVNLLCGFVHVYPQFS